uniref:Uncharacterized protein n=1 Tax=Anopheles atroparvus TaxID=41427 RepID=A0AAG5CZT9_ANOAO
MVMIIAITPSKSVITVSPRIRPDCRSRPKRPASRTVPIHQPESLPKPVTPNRPLSTSTPTLLQLLLPTLLLPVLLVRLLPLPALLEFHLSLLTLPSPLTSLPPKPPPPPLPPPKLNLPPSPPPLAISSIRFCPSTWKFEYRISVFQHSVSLWKARIPPGCKAPSRLRFWGPPALVVPVSYSNFLNTTSRRNTFAPQSEPSIGAAWSVIPAFAS